MSRIVGTRLRLTHAPCLANQMSSGYLTHITNTNLDINLQNRNQATTEMQCKCNQASLRNENEKKYNSQTTTGDTYNTNKTAKTL